MIVPEILAPAGSMEALYAAIHAGADAVYFGGKVLSARAYAGNFTETEIRQATELLHQSGAKAYLTLNTLVKNHELKLLNEIGDTLCQAGVDAVILQDMGAYLFFKKYFPELVLHASTQMTVHSIAGAKRLYDLGFERVVLSRELDLKEVKEIMAAVPIEVETFVHGALCYCYSGQCQMSAAYGERSANRGKCAQPCRLPYETGKQKGYFLSLKDQMTLHYLPELTAAGIHSFKIEGRMKNPEYVYTTTSMYRKYRDLALAGGRYQVEEADIQKMNEVFSRGQTSPGYYFVRKSAQMIFPEQPKTAKLTNAKTLAELSFVREKPISKVEINMEFQAKLHRPMQLIIRFQGGTADIPPVYQIGPEVEPAAKRAVTQADIEKPLSQIGDTVFILTNLKIDLAENAFIPLSQIKELRRQALAEAEAAWKKWLSEQMPKPKEFQPNYQALAHQILTMDGPGKSYSHPQVSVLVRTTEQLKSVLVSAADRIYLEWSFLAIEKIIEMIGAWNQEHQADNKRFFLALPTILRNQEQKCFWQDFHRLRDAFKEWNRELGALVRTADHLNVLSSQKIPVVLDHSLNIWNQFAYHFYLDTDKPVDICLSNEINYISRSKIGAFEMVIYGKLATMQTANCLANVHSQAGNKDKNPFCKIGAVESLDYITDRKGSLLGYHRNCKSCSNTLFNSVPLYLADLDTDFAHCLRFELLDEKPAEIARLMQIISEIKNGNKIKDNPFGEFTRGHYSKGVE